MIKSRIDNLFSCIFPDEKESASLIVKFMLVLETENLIPLFEVNGKNNSSLTKATVTNSLGEMLSVKEIMEQCQGKNQILPLFFGSNFQVSFFSEEYFSVMFPQLNFDTFLIFTQEGLILESQEEYLGFFIHENQSYYLPLSDKYSLISWEYWHNLELIFADNKPECSLLLTNNKDDCLEININHNFNSEAEQIESQLPLIFCFFILKNFWQYVEKFRHQSYFMFNPHDFLYLGGDRLSYFINNVLKNIEIKEDDLDILIRSC